jgi:dTDP-D-glucose 4,6-dehydratase
VYGAGENVRDWLHVDDHADALLLVAQGGALGDSYNIGGNNEYSNIAVVCDKMSVIGSKSASCFALSMARELEPCRSMVKGNYFQTETLPTIRDQA